MESRGEGALVSLARHMQGRIDSIQGQPTSLDRSGGEFAGEDAVAQLNAKTRALREANPRLSQFEAHRLAMRQNRQLAAAARAQCVGG